MTTPAGEDRPQTYTVVVAGYAVSGPEEDCFEVLDPDGNWVDSFGICALIRRCGGEVLGWAEREGFQYEGADDAPVWATEREEYRKRTGRERPEPPKRYRITVEVLND